MQFEEMKLYLRRALNLFSKKDVIETESESSETSLYEQQELQQPPLEFEQEDVPPDFFAAKSPETRVARQNSLANFVDQQEETETKTPPPQNQVTPKSSQKVKKKISPFVRSRDKKVRVTPIYSWEQRTPKKTSQSLEFQIKLTPQEYDLLQKSRSSQKRGFSFLQKGGGILSCHYRTRCRLVKKGTSLEEVPEIKLANSVFLTSKGPYRNPNPCFKEVDKSKWVCEQDFARYVKAREVSSVGRTLLSLLTRVAR